MRGDVCAATVACEARWRENGGAVIDEGRASLQLRRREDGGAVVVRVRCCG